MVSFSTVQAKRAGGLLSEKRFRLGIHLHASSKRLYAVVDHYLELARANCENELGKQYIRRASNICERFDLPKPFYLKRGYCPTCGVPLVPGKTARVRVNHGKLVVTCLVCGSVMRRTFPKRTKISPHEDRFPQPLAGKP